MQSNSGRQTLQEQAYPNSLHQEQEQGEHIATQQPTKPLEVDLILVCVPLSCLWCFLPHISILSTHHHCLSSVASTASGCWLLSLMFMLIPKWAQTPYGDWEPPNEIFLSASPFPYGESPYGNGDCMFCHPFSHADLVHHQKKWLRKRDFSAFASAKWRWSISLSPKISNKAKACA